MYLLTDEMCSHDIHARATGFVRGVYQQKTFQLRLKEKENKNERKHERLLTREQTDEGSLIKR